MLYMYNRHNRASEINLLRCLHIWYGFHLLDGRSTLGRDKHVVDTIHKSPSQIDNGRRSPSGWGPKQVCNRCHRIWEYSQRVIDRKEVYFALNCCHHTSAKCWSRSYWTTWESYSFRCAIRSSSWMPMTSRWQLCLSRRITLWLSRSSLTYEVYAGFPCEFSLFCSKQVCLTRSM